MRGRSKDEHGARARGLAASALLAFCAALALAPGRAAAASLGEEREFFLMAASTRSLQLAHRHVDPATFRLLVGDHAWQEGRDFRLLARDGLVVPLRRWAEPDAGEVVVMAVYRFSPAPLAPRLDLHPMGRAPVAGEEPGPAGETAEGTGGAPGSGVGFGDLDVRGSKSVHVASGSRRELTVDQNLRLSMEGRLTRDIAVRALLTDDNLPVVPEGNTEELQDIDNVLVELTAPRWRATLGDFVGERRGTVYGDYRRKLQGVTLLARPGPARAEVLAGSPRGRYRTVEIRGQEANQGPYFLGGGGSATLFLVAGSERVTLDGAVLTRGEDRDYVIDYVRGTITFTYRRLVTAQSLILVEFEEGEGPYARAVVGAGAGAAAVVPLAGAAGSLGVRLIRERDDAGRLRTGELADADEAVLAGAGDDPAAALAPGAVAVAPGTGDYRQEERDGITVFVFDAAGDWDVSFAYVGPGAGDYGLADLTETGAQVFTYLGPGQGSYVPGRLLPLPESHSLATLSASLGDSLGAGLDVEWDLSRRDLNTLSSRDDGDNDGEAGRVRLRSGRLRVGGGDLVASASLHERGGFFTPMLTDRTTFEYESWGLGERARRPGFLRERDRVVDGRVGWSRGDTTRAVRVEATVATLDHGADLEAARWQADADWRWRGGRGRSVVAGASARDNADPLEADRTAHDHDVAWIVGPVSPRVTLHAERWQDAAATTAAGFRYHRRGFGLAAVPGAAWNWEARYERDVADSLRAGGWGREREGDTWRGRLATPRVAGVRATGEATVRAIRRPAAADETARLARLDLAGAWPGVGSDWSLGYGVDNSRAEVLQRQIVFVGENEGNYDEAGDFVGIEQGAYNVVYAGTDSLVATTAVQADLAWRQDFAPLGAGRWWGAWASTTRVGVRSRSRTDDVGRLLRLERDALFDPQTVVLADVRMSEELDLLRHLRAWDLRLMWNLDETRDRQFVSSQEDRLRRRYQGTLTWNATTRASLRLRAAHEGDRRTTDAVENAARQSHDTRARTVELEGSLRPTPGDRLALAVEAGRREDDVSGVVQDEIAVAPAVRWRPRTSWTVQLDLRLADVTSREPAGARRPYFFPRPGGNVDASARVSWNPSEFLTFALVHTGRKQGDLEWQHELRLESSARF